MEILTFRVGIITPTIMHGAYDRRLDSLKVRASEIKSAMRYAFRLVASNYIEHNEKGIRDLLRTEGEIFGDTSKKAKFKIILEDTENLNTDDIKVLPHKSHFIKKCVLPNQSFTLKLLPYKYDKEFYKALLNIAFLIGVGYRRNRLFGNMQIEDCDLEDEINKIHRVCKELFKREPRNVETPIFASLSYKDKEKGIKNYETIEKELPNLKRLDINSVEQLLKNLYIKIIRQVEKYNTKNGKPVKHILGYAGGQGRQGSYVNFSIQKVKDSYRLFMISFYYKNKNFDYETWLEGTEKIKELVEKFEEQI